MTIIVATFYHFFDFTDRVERKAALQDKLDALGIRGTLLLAPEGINSTLAGSRDAIDAFLCYLREEVVCAFFEHKESMCPSQPFKRAKVRLKKETITLGRPVQLHRFGEYIAAENWNEVISDPDTVILDARNDYELHLGTFENAVDPNIDAFRQLPGAVEKLGLDKTRRIATFCTGGIRCEKLTAWLIENGYDNVCHLKGGILKYLEVVPEEQSLWRGECYVFDERVAVGHGLKPTAKARLCISCGYSIANHSVETGETNEMCVNCRTRSSSNVKRSA